jgi:hypothetical protein
MAVCSAAATTCASPTKFRKRTSANISKGRIATRWCSPAARRDDVVGAGLFSAKWLEQKYKKPNQRIENDVQTNGTLLNDVHHPPGASLWGLRLQFVLLFPKLTKQQEKMVLEQKLTGQMNQEPPKK